MEEEHINSGMTDKLEGMEHVMKIIKDRECDLRLIVWDSEDEKGHHIFRVCFDTKTEYYQSLQSLQRQ